MVLSSALWCPELSRLRLVRPEKGVRAVRLGGGGVCPPGSPRGEAAPRSQSHGDSAGLSKHSVHIAVCVGVCAPVCMLVCTAARGTLTEIKQFLASTS